MRGLTVGLLYVLLWAVTALSWPIALIAIIALGGSPAGTPGAGFGLLIFVFLTLNVLCLASIPAIPFTFGIGAKKLQVTSGVNSQANTQEVSADSNPRKSQVTLAWILGIGTFFGIPFIHGEYKAAHHREVAKNDQINRDFIWPDNVAYYKGTTGCNELCAELLFDQGVKSLTVYPQNYKYKEIVDKNALIKTRPPTTFTVENRTICPDPWEYKFQDYAHILSINSTVGRCLIATPKGDQKEPVQIMWDVVGRTTNHRDNFEEFSRLRITQGLDGHRLKPNDKSILAQRTNVQYYVWQTPFLWPFPKAVRSGGTFGDTSYRLTRDPLYLARIISPLGEAGDEHLEPSVLKRKFNKNAGSEPHPEDVLNHAITILSDLKTADMPADILTYKLAGQVGGNLRKLPKATRPEYRKPLGLALLNAAQAELNFRVKDPEFKLLRRNKAVRHTDDLILKAYMSMVYERREPEYREMFSDHIESIQAFEESLLKYVAGLDNQYDAEKNNLKSYDTKALNAAIRMLLTRDKIDTANFAKIWKIIIRFEPPQNSGFQVLLIRYNQLISEMIIEDILKRNENPPEGVTYNNLASLLIYISDEQFEAHFDRINVNLQKHSEQLGLYPLASILHRIGKRGESAWPILTQHINNPKRHVREGVARGLCLSNGPLSEENYIKLRDELFFHLKHKNTPREYLSYFSVAGYMDRFVDDLETTLGTAERKHVYNSLKKSVRKYSKVTPDDCKSPL